MNLHNSENTPARIQEFRIQLDSILSSLKTVLERKALDQEDAKLIAIAYQNAQDLITVTKNFLSKNNLGKEGDSLMGFLEKEMEGIISDFSLQDEESLAPIYQKIKVLDNSKPLIESQSIYELNDSDNNWLLQIGQTVEQEISNFDFNAETLASKVFISRRQLDRRIKLLTGMTTSQFIRNIRMKTAHDLIKEKKINSIKAIAFQVGIKSVSHFSKQYKDIFKKSPSEELRG